jgi:hypothetical protein
MKKIVFYLFFFLSLFLANSIKAGQHVKKFENPALQFEGTWRVDAYDWREFKGVPADLVNQLQVRAASFPIGQKIRFKWSGLSLMPGNYNPKEMEFDGPVGETLEVTILAPFENELCKGYWSYLCNLQQKNYVKSFMIVEIEKWDTADPEKRLMWPDIKPVEYSLVDFSKSHNIDAWFDKQGDMIFPIIVDGQSKRGADYGTLGVRLKRIN